MADQPTDLKSRSLYARLKRLFSTDVIVRNVGGKKLKVVDTDEVAYATDRNTLRDRFNRIRTSAYNQYSRDFTLSYQAARLELFRDYDTMDMDPILSSALDIYSDECLTRNELGEILVIKTPNDNIKQILHNLYYDIMNIEFNLWSYVRNLAKYGDFYLRMYISPEYGVYMIEPISAYNVTRVENSDLYNKNYTKFQVNLPDGGKVEDLENYQIAHFRLLSDSNFLPYGKSMLEGARRVWKQLSLMEDAMLIHRVMRAPEKRIFKIDVGNIPPNEIDSYMEQIINKTKKIPYIDEKTGDYNLRFNLQNMVEDFYLPVRGGDSGTSIEPLSGMEFTGTDDIEYLRNKMMAALKIPKAFLGYDESLCISPETKIPLLNGEEKTVYKLIEDYNNGIKNYVFSIDEDTKNIVPGEIEWAGFTKMNTEVVRVTLDNGEFIDCTPDHPFMTRDGKWINAIDLMPNQSLMPLYLDKSNDILIKNYTTVYNPSSEKYEMLHRLVANYYNLKTENKVIHHKDLNKWNNYPENLDCSMNFFEHRQFHTKLAKNGNESLAMRLYHNSDECKENCRINGKLGGIKSAKKLGEWVKKNGPANKGKRSGKIIKCLNCNNNIYSIPSFERKFCSNECYTNFFGSNRYNTKFTTIQIDELIKSASELKSFKELCKKLNIDRNTLNRCFEYNSIDKSDFIMKHMPKAQKNVAFMNNYKNHKVVSVTRLSNKIDTCDITIKKYHNFAVSAGVIIHNSGKATLAQEDVRFSRTIERMQRIIISELVKIGIVHLYAQGYKDAALVDFSLELTNPSTVFEKEKIAIWTEKVTVSKDMMENKLFSKKWIYDNVFNLSDDDMDVLKNEIVDDSKQAYRFKQIEEEGNDPAKSFQKMGQEGEGGGGEGGGGDEGGGESGEEAGGGGGEEAGGGEAPLKEKTDDERPSQKGLKKASNYPFGEDVMGNLANNEKSKINPISHRYKNDSPFSLESIKQKDLAKLNDYLKNLKAEKQELLSESTKKSFLDESNIIPE